MSPKVQGLEFQSWQWDYQKDVEGQFSVGCIKILCLKEISEKFLVLKKPSADKEHNMQPVSSVFGRRPRGSLALASARTNPLGPPVVSLYLNLVKPRTKPLAKHSEPFTFLITLLGSLACNTFGMH